ncbi:Scr1 family TA system antitoxin-like transcriptional regulator [Streptacidiphilus sp. N1-3]|uniref:Scr1 family TA system antitoxin-like transcriptional regulator n=1 Tax=Streptacidiphilus alkalitolerans TaxID=3342712 RepID=A0ABV6X3B7_9ACTN
MHYCPDVVWGDLQTADYVRAMLRIVADFTGSPAAAEDIEAGVALRTARIQHLGDEGRAAHVLLGEQALYTNIGGSAVMSAQLHRLRETTELDGLRFGVVPRSAPSRGVFPGPGFGLFDRAEVLIEGFAGEFRLTDAESVAVHLRAFAALERTAVYGGAARGLLGQAERHWRTSEHL